METVTKCYIEKQNKSYVEWSKGKFLTLANAHSFLQAVYMLAAPNVIF